MAMARKLHFNISFMDITLEGVSIILFVVQIFYMMNSDSTYELLKKMNDPVDFTSIADNYETNNKIDAYVLLLVFILCIRYAEIIWVVNFFSHVMHEVGVSIVVLYLFWWMVCGIFA